MPVSIHGKSYVMVHERIRELHEQAKKDGTQVSIKTKPVETFSDKLVRFKATLIIRKDGKLISEFTGYAEEIYGSTKINKTSALENTETSAVGRALGFAGYGSEDAISSADEVQGAINSQNQGVDISKITETNETKKVTPPKLVPRSNKMYKELEEMLNEIDSTKLNEKQMKYYDTASKTLVGAGITRFHFNSIKETLTMWKSLYPNIYKKGTN